MKTRLGYAAIALITALFALAAHAQSADKWVAAWAGSVQGPYPIGNPSAQPDMRFAFPSAEVGPAIRLSASSCVPTSGARRLAFVSPTH